MKTILISLAGSLLMISACKSHKVATSDTQPTTVAIVSKPDSVVSDITKDSSKIVSPNIPIQTVVAIEDSKEPTIDEIDFTYLTSKSKVSFKSADQSYDNANVSIRIKKDSIIWFNVTAIGLNVARGIFTKDGLSIMNSINKEYYLYNYDTLNVKFGTKLDFDRIQSIIVGNMPIKKKPREVRKEKDYLLLHQEEGKVMIDSYIGQQNRKLRKLLVQQQPTNTTMQLEYDDFQALNSFLFPYTNLVTVDYQKDKQFYQLLLKIKHQKVELPTELLSFPFSIPDKYERRY
jgi:Domain of unknown function (DUF4292)